MLIFRILLIVLIKAFVLNATSAQLNGTGSEWDILRMVTYDKKYDENLGFEVQVPKVNGLVKMKEGQEIEIEGYIIPLQGKVKQSHFMLSLFPYNMCFFCGKAGPETAMQVFMNDDIKVEFTDQKIRLKGILRINEKDINSLLYTLESAEKL